MRPFSRFVVLIIWAAFFAACGGGGGTASPVASPPSPSPPPFPPPPVDLIPDPIAKGNVDVRLTLIAEDFGVPIWGTHIPNDPTRLFVVDQTGQVTVIDLATRQKKLYLDVSGRIFFTGTTGDERGFLGLAFHPNFVSNGLLYTYTSEPDSGTADFALPGGLIPNHQSVVAEWRVNNPGDPNDIVNPNSRRELLRIDQPNFAHNAGALEFDNNGYLLISLGDGGDLLDPADYSQNPESPLGAILRVDPRGNNSDNGNYGIPATNPFFGMAGFIGEIYAYGFRNPFRMSIDRLTGLLWAGDVGEGIIEEVDQVVAGGNYGWSIKEGSFCIDSNGDAKDPADCDSTGLSDPIAEFDRDEGNAVIGGFVYRGSRIGALDGHYAFGTLNGPGNFLENSGRLFYLDGSTILEITFSDRAELGSNLVGFGQDADSEIYVMVFEPPIGIGGKIYRIDPP